MICVKCKQAYNGSDRRCHMCGAVYPLEIPVIEHAVNEQREIAVIKKKSHKKGVK